MKSRLLTFSAITLLLYTAQIRAELLDECIKEANVDGELLKRASNNPQQNDPKFKDFLFCFNKKTGVQSSEGVLQKDVIKRQYLANRLSTEFVDKMITKCAVQKSTPSETAYEFAKCAYLEKVSITNKASNRT